MQSLVILISGMPASGKDTVSENLHKTDSRYTILKKYRAIGANDTPKQSYYNVSVDEFKKKVANGDFLQYHGRYERYYGIDKSVLLSMLQENLIPIIHIGRIQNYYALMEHIKAFQEENHLSLKVVHIQLWEKQEVLRDRIAKREKAPDEIGKRVLAMNQEFHDAIAMMEKNERPFTLVIRNSDIAETIDKITSIEPPPLLDDGYEEFWAYLKKIEVSLE